MSREIIIDYHVHNDKVGFGFLSVHYTLFKIEGSLAAKGTKVWLLEPSTNFGHVDETGPPIGVVYRNREDMKADIQSQNEILSEFLDQLNDQDIDPMDFYEQLLNGGWVDSENNPYREADGWRLIQVTLP